MARGKDMTPTLRARICELHDVGWGYRRIHKRYPEIAISTIGYTVKQQSRRDDQASRPRKGRPPMVSIEEQAHIFELKRQNPDITLRQLQAAVASKPCTATIRRILRRGMPSSSTSPATVTEQMDQNQETEQMDQNQETEQTQETPQIDTSGAIRDQQ